jgi:hypothetical protein
LLLAKRSAKLDAVKFVIIALATGLAFMLTRWGSERFVRRIEHQDTLSRGQDGLEADKANLAKYRNTGQPDL